MTHRIISCLLFLVPSLLHGTSFATEPDSQKQQHALKLRPYIGCDGFAGGVRGVIRDRRPQGAQPWREVGFGGMSGRVSVVDGYRVMYSYARTFAFANLKAERSDPSRYADDKRIVTLNVVEMARSDVAIDLSEFSHHGFSGQMLTKKELGGSTLGITQIFSDEDAVIVTIFFLNQEPGNRKFQAHAEFISLRDGFVRGYIECVARKRSAPAVSQ